MSESVYLVKLVQNRCLVHVVAGMGSYMYLSYY